MNNKALLLCIGLCLFGCNKNNVSTESSSSSVNVTYLISGPTYMNVGEVAMYTINYEGEINWTSSDPLVLEINSRGEAVTYTEGDVTISAYSSMSLIASLEVEVGNKIARPTNEVDLASLFNNAMDLEQDISSAKLTITKSDIQEIYTQEVTMYQDFYINISEDEYTNYKGYHHEESETFVGIKNGYFYDVDISSEASYAIKRKVVKSNPTDYEILESEAIKRASTPRFVYSFYSKVCEMWGGRTLDLKIEVTEEKDGFKVKLSNTYLFLWANGIDNDSKCYDAELHFSDDGHLISGEYKLTTYAESQYDASKNTWKDDAIITSVEACKYEAKYEEKKANSEATIIPEEYFVTKVIKASYVSEKPLEVGNRIISDNIVLEEYEGPKAIDVNNVIIKGIKNDGNQVVIIEDTLNGGYEIINTGRAYLICQMMYSSDVTFLVEINVD